MTQIHRTAVVDPRAKLGGDVEVGPYTVIGEDVELAPGVVVGSHVSIGGRTTIGSGTRIYPHAVIGADPQVSDPRVENAALVIGEGNLIREYTSIHVGTTEGGGCTRVGNRNFLMNHVHVAHDCQIGSDCVLASYVGLGGHVVIEDQAVIGGKSGIHQFVRVGESVFAGGNAMLVKDAPPFTRVAGDRARLAGMNTVGLRRRGFSEVTIAAIKHAIHVLFQSKLRFDAAEERVASECGDSPEVARLLHFLRESRASRGFIR